MIVKKWWSLGVVIQQTTKVGVLINKQIGFG